MTVRGANYKRKPHDNYPTPAEVTRVLLDNVRFSNRLCDPACGKGNMLKVFEEYGYEAMGTDIRKGVDFISDMFEFAPCDIVTNPPYGGRSGRLALAFVERALELTNRKVAMLLPVDFDSGRTREGMFGRCEAFREKIILLDRIRWFNNRSGSTNHAWFIWDWENKEPPTITYRFIYDQRPARKRERRGSQQDSARLPD